MEGNDRIYEKLRRIKALADQAGSTSEAEAAIRAFHRVLARHNLSMAMWEIESESKSDPIKWDYQIKNAAVWRSHLLHVASSANYCKAIAGYNGRHYIFGTNRNIDAAKQMYEWLEGVIDRVSESYPCPPGESVRSFRNAFRHGMVTGIRSALSQEENDIRQRNSDLSSLVPLLRDEAEKAARDAFPQTKKLKATVGSSAGYTHGVVEGKKVRRKVDQLPP